MPGMRGLFAISLAVGIVTAALDGRIAAAAELPPGPNRDFVVRTCSACHGIENLVGHALTREGWETVVEGMIGYGLEVTPGERHRILEYLATALGPDSAAAKR